MMISIEINLEDIIIRIVGIIKTSNIISTKQIIRKATKKILDKKIIKGRA